MDVTSTELHLATWTVTSLLCVFSHGLSEVTVTRSDLKPCDEDEHVCVTDLRDCGPPPPPPAEGGLNMSCYYELSLSSVTCEWSPDSDRHSEASLIFSSEDKIFSCWALLNPAAILNITARIKNYLTGSETWSRPYTVFLTDAVKPPPPVLTVLGSTEDSVAVSWRSTADGSCQLRYRASNAHNWTPAPDSVPAHRDQTLTYTVKDLLPFTAYRAAVACREQFTSSWSSEVTARTLDRAPSRPPEVCYRVEKTHSAGYFLLHLMWKDPNLRDARGRVLGYQVSYEPARKRQLQDRLIQNVTEATALLEVEDGNYSVTVTAFNSAGCGPAAHLSVDTRARSALPSVRNLWVSSSFPATKGLLVQWEKPTAPTFDLPVSHFAVQWCSETRPSTSHWTTVDRSATSTVIQGVDPDRSYVITVFPVYSQQCGSPQSLPASLKLGALMEAVTLKVVGVTKTTATAVWAWQRTSGPIRVNRYSMTLREDSEGQTVSLWPDQWKHTFLNLKPNTEYSLLLLAENVSRNILLVRTDFDELPAVATAAPLLLLAVTVFIICILSRTVYKSYFFPHISSPRGSTTGQWLMDPNHQKPVQRHFLDMEDFQLKDVPAEKSVTVVGPDPREDACLLSVRHLVIKLSTEYVSISPVIPEEQLAPLQPSRAALPEESREADAAPLHPTPAAGGCLPQREEPSLLREANVSRPCTQQVSCEAEPVLSSSSLVEGGGGTGSGHTDSHLMCDPGYIVI